MEHRPPTEVELTHLREALAGEFEIVRPLGKGSMAMVYLARELALQRFVAIKLPHPELASAPEPRRRFVREARAAARIVHDGAVRIYRVGALDSGTPYIVMEYVEGRPLDQVLAAEGPLPMEVGLYLLEQVAGALAAAHEQGVIHRDVRPANVLWGAPARRAVLADFGLAGLRESETADATRITRPGEALGNPAYVSPEQLEGRSVTTATDVWSFGILAFHVLSGRGPWGRPSAGPPLPPPAGRRPFPLSEFLPSANPRLVTLLGRCLDTDPERRPSADHLARCLEDIRLHPSTGTVPAVPRPTAPLLRFFEELRRRRVGNVIVAYAIAVFGLLQVVEPLATTYTSLEPVLTGMVRVLLASFPLVLVLAWIYDLRGGRLERTTALPAGHRSWGLMALQVLGLLISLALVVWVGRVFL